MTALPLRKDFQPGLGLIEDAKNGVEAAWTTIYEELAGPVTGYLRSRGAIDAEDLSSEVFFQVARDIHRFKGDTTQFRSWVFVIAHRRLIDQRRSLGRRPDMVDDSADTLDIRGGDVEQEVMEGIGTAGVLALFNKLTDDQKDVLTLRIVADLSLEETASVMRKRVGAVKALQRRALGSVRAQLEDGGVTL